MQEEQINAQATRVAQHSEKEPFIPRKYRRLEAKRIKETQSMINTIAQEWVGEVLEGNLDFNDQDIFIKWDNRWRRYAKKQIFKYPNIYHSKEARERILGHFERFVVSIREKENKGILENQNTKELTADEKFAKVRQELKEYGIKTTSNTKAGLLRVVEKRLDPKDSLAINLTEILNSVL